MTPTERLARAIYDIAHGHAEFEDVRLALSAFRDECRGTQPAPAITPERLAYLEACARMFAEYDRINWGNHANVFLARAVEDARTARDALRSKLP